MTPVAAVQVSTSFLLPLATTAARVVLLAGVAGVGLAAFRVKATPVRLFTWTAVLYAAVAMPLLERMLPAVPLPTPAFLQQNAVQPAPDQTQVLRPHVTGGEITSMPPRQETLAVVNIAKPASSTNFKWSGIGWNAVAVGIYFAIAFFLLVRFIVGLIFSRRLKRTSRIIKEPRLSARVASYAHVNGLAFIPQAAESEMISVPVTMGVLGPAILLPATWREWDDTKLDAILAHEMSHIARRDTLTQRLSLLHCAIFWFSPLAWWLNRHLADLAEQASDEAALACGTDRKAYARTLLGFFEALNTAPGRVWWQGVSMANAGRAEQRVERILAWKGAVAMRFKKSIAVVVVALAVPVVYLAASAQPVTHSSDSKPVEIAQAAVPSVPPEAPHAPRAPRKPSNHSSYSYGYDDSQRFVIVTGNSDSLTMSGSSDDGMRVEELREKIPGDFIWFRRDGKSYIIRDQATFSRAKSFWAPQEELGKKQEELGKQQEALGEQQEALGKKMEQVKVNVPDMSKELEKLQAKLKQLGATATMDQVGDLQSEIGDLQSKIGDIQSQAGDRQSKLGDEMGALGEKQGELGDQQGELGREQGELAEQANRQMKQLLDEAITKGTAQLQQ